MKNLKKLFAVLLSVVMLLSLCACGGNADQEADPTDGDKIQQATAAGMLLLAADAELKISYDAEGLVLTVEGNNASGTAIADKYTDALGKSCTAAVQDLIQLILEENVGAVKTVFIKQAMGSKTPSETFLETILTDAKIAADGYQVIMATAEELDDEGYIPLATAEALLRAHLGLAEDTELASTAAPIDGLYTISFEVDGVMQDYAVDADTGLVDVAQTEGIYTEPDVREDEQPSTDGENIPESEISDPITEEPEIPVEEEDTF